MFGSVRLPAAPRIESTIGYKVDPPWPKEKPPGGEWAAMSRVVVAPDGNVWTFNAYSPDGNLVKYWAGAPRTFKNPGSITPPAYGWWITDAHLPEIRLQRGSAAGSGTPDESGEDATQLNQPNDEIGRAHV